MILNLNTNSLLKAKKQDHQEQNQTLNLQATFLKIHPYFIFNLIIFNLRSISQIKFFIVALSSSESSSTTLKSIHKSSIFLIILPPSIFSIGFFILFF